MFFQRLDDGDGKGEYVVGPSGKKIFSKGHILFLEEVGPVLDGEAIPEFVFDADRKWAFDWAWPDLMVACEYEGNVYGGGKGHRSVGKFVKDMEKYNQAAIQGWCVIRAGSVEMLNGKFAGQLHQAIARRVEEREAERDTGYPDNLGYAHGTVVE